MGFAALFGVVVLMSVLTGRARTRGAGRAGLALVLSLSSLGASARMAPPPEGGLLVLAYHEVGDRKAQAVLTSLPPSTAAAVRRGAADAVPGGETYRIDVSALVAHLGWLRDHGYVAVSLSQVIAAREGGPPLPSKAVLLTFDDGYEDFHRRVFPVLKLFNWPAVIALVGRWMEVPEGGMVDYGGEPVPRAAFMSWDQVREVVRSGLVEVASHSYDLHRGVPANPQGNVQPAAVTRIWDAATQTYESTQAWQSRLRTDLERNARLIERETGARPRAMVWPYGRHNGEARRIAQELGMPVAFGLQGGWNPKDAPLSQMRRLLIQSKTSTLDLAAAAGRSWQDDPIRVIHVDLDYVYDADPEVQERNLSSLIERVAALRPSDVYLQAYADPDGDGEADALYFPNRHLPVRADLFNRVAWQLETRAEVRVHAWMPVLAFRLPKGHPAGEDVVQAAGERAGSSYRRLSPFSPRVRETVAEIYEDLAAHAPFAGLLFHDDALLGDHEDASPFAMDAARAAGIEPVFGPLEKVAPERRPEAERFARWRSQALVEFTRMLAERAGRWRSPLLTARNLYAAPVLDPSAQGWFSQSLPLFLSAYDRVALMAMPYMEGARGAKEARAMLGQMVASVAREPQGLERTVFELQARDWKRDAPVPAAELAGWMRQLELAGARHFGWYPDDWHADMPAADTVTVPFSVRSTPRR